MEMEIGNHPSLTLTIKVRIIVLGLEGPTDRKITFDLNEALLSLFTLGNSFGSPSSFMLLILLDHET